jgi:hypothetical protein
MSITVSNSKIVRGPNVVTDGLVFYLDAINPDSYPGSGTIWSDITEYSPDITTTATYSSGYLKYELERSTIGTYSALQGDVDCTIECWWRPNTGGIKTTCCDSIFGRYDFRFFQINNSLYTMIGFNNGTRYYQHPSFAVSYDQWHHAVGMRRNNTYIICIDGIQRYSTSYGTGDPLNNTTEPWYVSQSGHPNVDISICKIYDRGITDVEILQNFNSQKSRFGY